MTATHQTPDTLGLGPVAPTHRDGRDQRGAYSDAAEADALLAADIRETRLVRRLLRLGGEVPADRWEKIDAVLDRLLASDKLSARDAVRIAAVQAARERVIATATGKVLDKLAADQIQVAGTGEAVTVRVEYVDDYWGTAEAGRAAELRRLREQVPDATADAGPATPGAPRSAPPSGATPSIPEETAPGSSPSTTTANE